MRLKPFLLLIIPALSACATATPEKFTADKPLFEHASKLFKNGNYTDAITFFGSLRNRFPQSPYLLETELKLGEARFEKGEYAEAEVDFSNFRLLHPTHPKVPYAVLKLGMTHYKRIPRGSGRDSSHTERAVAIFDELCRVWPASPEAEKAAPLLKKAKRKLLEREMYVADFYLKQKEWGASLDRLSEVAANAEFKDLSSEATYKLGYAHFKLKNRSQAKEILEQVARNSDAGKYREKADDLLKKIGSP